jgi:hypothetical protein
MSTIQFSGYTPWDFNYNTEVEKVFKAVAQGFDGVTYKMVAFATQFTQVVRGFDYCFIAEGTLDGLDQRNKIAVLIYAHQPIGGSPVYRGQKDIGPLPTGAPGGWTFWKFFTATDPAPSLPLPLGVDYEALGVTNQLAGIVANSVYLCKATVVAPGSHPFAALLSFRKILDGPMVLRSIERIEP